MEWSNEYTFKAEDKLNADSDLAGHVYRRLAQRLTENGTGEGGFVVQHHQGGDKVRILAKVMEETGLRTSIGNLSMDTSSRPSYVEPSAQAFLDFATSFVEKCYALDEAKTLA